MKLAEAFESFAYLMRPKFFGYQLELCLPLILKFHTDG